ncbi:mechanosensitive ion channel family protein [Roseicella aerolata]|uniref:Small-conductance mechanosensitive channel n=1 Tax=Roseicella aerolata TaxID=2883479 RepID=A0A9X1IF04_9PROT|nr:mechanosensitive ion channel family protein [Roseicella aerolata]MCB4823566.1 mechanosensitive ion channel family protein [Roseicella aerolata]
MDLDAALTRIRALADATLALLPGLLLGLLVLGLFLLLARAVRAAVARAVALRAGPPGLALVLGRIGAGLTVLLGIFVAAAIAFPSISAADLFGVLGIGGVAIGFAFRDILQNMLAGILLLLTQPFRLGDQIKAGEFEGTVEDIQIRATTIRTYDNRRAVIPNSDLFSGKVLVNTAYDRRRLALRFGIGNGDDIAAAKRVILQAARGAEGVLPEPAPVVRVAELGDFAVQLDLFFWIDPPQRVEALDVIDRVLERAKAALTDAGIDLPYPTQQILLHDQTEATDGDRARQREGWPARPGGGNPQPRWRAMDGMRRPDGGGAGRGSTINATTAAAGPAAR